MPSDIDGYLINELPGEVADISLEDMEASFEA